MIKPYHYQNVGALQIERFAGRALLADEMGLGKTAQSLLWLRRNPQARPAVVVCPASLKWNWSREAMIHFNMTSQVLETTRAKGALLRPDCLLIINYDILHAWLDRLRAVAPKLVIIDEAQCVSNRRARRSKCVKRLCEDVEHVIALSGTPLTNRPAELWQILNIVRPDLYPKFFSFAQAFCSPKRKPWGWCFDGASNLDVLHADLKKTMMIRRLKQDVLKDLPPKRTAVVVTQLSDEHEYKRAVKDFIHWLTQIDPVRALKAMRAEKLTRLGYLKRLIGELKLNSVTDWIDNYLDSTQDKLVVFAIHQKVIEQLCARYRGACVKVDGTVTGRARQRAVDSFQNGKSVRLFVGNIQAAGKGLTLTAAPSVAFAEIGWTPGEMSQAEDRIHRIGQTRPSMCYYLVARDTLELRLLEIISRKQKVLDATLDGIAEDQGADVYEEICNELIVNAKREELRGRR